MIKKFADLGSCLLLTVAFFTLGCSAQTEEQALARLREMTREGKLPAESVVADIESRFANKRTGALARLLRARIKLESGDAAGAAAMLNSDVFKRQTKVADHAMWLRGKALAQSGNYAEAMRVLAELVEEHPHSVRAREAKLLWAASAIPAGRAVEVPPMLVDLSEKNDGDALLATAKAYESQGSQAEATQYYRRTYFSTLGSAAAKEAESKLNALGQPIAPQTAEEHLTRADRLIATRSYSEAATAYSTLAAAFPAAMTTEVNSRRLTAAANAGRAADALSAFNSIPTSAKEKEEAHRQLALAYAKAKLWQQARSAVDDMKQAFPSGKLVVKTMVDVGAAARDAKNTAEASYFFNTALSSYPNAIEVAQAQFEAAWMQHEAKNYAISSQMLIEHLARYTDKDNTNRGKAGYWAARDTERIGNIDDACILYNAVTYRYGANWYGHLASQRLSAIRAQGKCGGPDGTGIVKLSTSHSPIARAEANLRLVTVAPETAGEKELERAGKSDELSIIGLFDWAIDELNEAKKTAATSPKINLALARHYRLKGDQVNALLSLAKSYPDYAQMFPEELGREEWDIFYPLTHWDEIKKWAAARGLDKYQVAGIIRQETIFDPRAKSHADAYGYMQLLMPTARSMARKYNSRMPTSIQDLFDPSLNIELGTAYMKDQFDKFGRFEYVGIAYNAGPGRVPQWTSKLPSEMDEFVEAIPFKETKGYVQGIIRNSAQYRRLYDDNGNFKPNVGSKPLRGEIDSKPREQLSAEYPDLKLDTNDGE